MRTVLLSLSLVVVALVAGPRRALAGPPAGGGASAPPSSTPWHVSSADLVEIGWTDPLEGRTRLSLALPPERACSSVEIDRDRRSTQLTLCRNSAEGEPPLVELKLVRVDQNLQPGEPARTLRLQASARLRRGAPITIGRFEPGGPRGAAARDLPRDSVELVATWR